MKPDRELLEAAAKAMGIEFRNGKTSYTSADGRTTGWRAWKELLK